MFRKVLRATAFLCLLAMMAVTLTGCADVFEKVVNFIKTVVKTVKDVFGKVDKVVTTVKDAVKTGKNTVDKIKDIFKGGDKKPGTDKGKGGGKITNPEDDMDDAKGGGGTTSGGSSTGPGKGPGKGPGTGAGDGTEPPGSEAEKARLSSELEKALTNLDGKIKQLEKLLKEDLPAATKEQIEEILERMKDLKKVLEGTKGDLKTADTQSELDRIKEDLEDSQKGFIKLVETIQKIVSGIKKAGDTAISIINKIKTWTKILTGGTTGAGGGTGTSGEVATVAGLAKEIRATYGIEVKDGVTADIGWGFKTTAGSWDVPKLTIMRDTLAKLPPHFVKCTTLVYSNQSIVGPNSGCYGIYNHLDGTMWMSDSAMRDGRFAGTLVHEMTHAFQRSNPQIMQEWTKLFWNGNKPRTPSPTEYGDTKPVEDMAESVRLYFEDPAALKLDKARYEFIKKFIMRGVEF